MSRTQVSTQVSTELPKRNGRLSPIVHLASTSLHLASTSAQMPAPQPDKDITPWLDTVDEIPVSVPSLSCTLAVDWPEGHGYGPQAPLPRILQVAIGTGARRNGAGPTPPPKPSRTFNVSPQTSLTSMRNGSMSSYYHSNGHRPSTNLSISTNNSLELNDSVDDYGQALMAPELDLPPTQDIEIAPWLVDSSPQDPPSPPPKNGRSFHFPPKGSFSSLRSGSSSGLFSRLPRGSESHSNLSIADSTIASTSTSMMHEPRDRSFSPTPELRKTKSSMFSSLRKKVSKKSLRSSSNAADESEHPSLRPPPLNTGGGNFVSFLPIPSPPQTPRFKRMKKKPSHPEDVPPLPTIEPPDPGEQEIKLDMNFNEMDGIIDMDILNPGNGAGPAPGSPTTSSDPDPASSSGMTSLSSDHQFGGVAPKFNNPFPPGGAFYQPHKPSRKVSPNTVPPLPDPPVAPLASGPGGPVPAEGWTAPESWSVAVKDGTDPVGEAGESSSDESGGGTRHGHGHRTSVVTGQGHGHHGPPPGRSLGSSLGSTSRSNGAGGLTTGAGAMHLGGVKEDYGVNGALVPGAAGHARRAPGVKRTAGAAGAGAGAQHKIRIRIYKADNTYHVVSVSTNVTVAALTPKLDQKLPAGEEREMHQLYLKERGRERILAQTERPADIVRRRLEQAGYDDTDGQDLLGGAGLTFLLKFVYKSLFLGPAEEELKFDNFEYIDLTGRSLRTIPVALHQHADSIVSLRLSRNPMIEIPLDFIQSCTTLRELRLSHMAMKKVPHSLRHSTTLTRLDLSCNRIVTLDEAYLDDIPGLTTLHVQNNRLEKLPWSFPRLRRLITLNISNNKFRMFPAGVSELINLRDLDISFNMISELPEEIGKLKNLERLVIVGNQVSKLPDEFSNLGRLGELDCRRNQISDLTVACMLPKIETLSADHNALHELTLSMGPSLTTLDASHNEITQLTLVRGPVGRSPFALTHLDVSNAKLSVLDDYTLSQLTSLRRLKLDSNSFRSIPESLGDLKWLETLSCADNSLGELPQSIGRLQKLETLDVHNNSLTELPISLWNCASLSRLNVTSNLLVLWHDPPPSVPDEEMSSSFSDNTVIAGAPLFPNNRKPSTSTISDIPPLAHSLEMLYLGENSFTDEVLHPLMILKELRVLNLSFNDIQDMPSNFFRHLTKLEEVYLSGNGLTNIPSEDLPKLTRLSTLFLNGNRLQTLPQELGKVKSLTVLDVGSNWLKYNINNWEFDWNWNFNKNLRYLNLSGNKRLQIKSDVSTPGQRQSMSTVNRESLAGFSELTQLRVLGLMDVTITTTGTNTGDIPDENDDRRVRTSSSVVNGMSYGIADTLGKNEHLNMLDLVHEFRGIKKDAVFAMFGRAQPPKQLPAATTSNRLAKYLQENFVRVFISQINSLDPERNEGVPDALRRSFLKLNQDLHDTLFSSTRKMSQTSTGTNPVLTDPSVARSGASGIVVYILDKKMYIANVGNALAVVSKGGSAVPVSTKHDPYDRAETARIRAAEGWISPPGLVGDEIDISRSFGFYHLLPIINARPDIVSYDLTELDEFVIVANRGLWDYVSYQTAVDIAQRTDPMIAAQKLRDFAISYGADGSTMIMVIGVADLFKGASTTPAPGPRKKPGIGIIDRTLNRLKEEVPPPVGHLAIVFTDIKGSTHLWEANPGMSTAIRLHNSLLRRYLRVCGGYEVKTEGDSFMCSFPTVLAAVWWCMTVQVELLNVPWPLEILECADGKAVYDEKGRLIARGLSVRMGIHCGTPLCETDPVTNRMDYLGPMVNRSSRIESSAAGGHIMCSSDVIREINAKIFESEPETEYSDAQPQEAIDGIRRLVPEVVPVGEVRLKGLEVPEMLSLIFPSNLIGRKDLDDTAVDPTGTSGSRVQFSVAQMRELAMLCLRLEMSSSGRVFRSYPERKGSLQGPEVPLDEDEPSIFLHGDANVLLPPMPDKMTDADLMLILYSLMVRIENAEKALCTMAGAKPPPSDEKHALMSALQRSGGLDERTLDEVWAVLRSI
ncbi:Adenylate cyclase [Mycena venus]|uniref:Adenylate cyclase n=1 Tax=Mycena venus TaxID=2733690 RepID=A0A8H6YFC4_9AGAR|nr:Adenylate cyclase [Mycena venus]